MFVWTEDFQQNIGIPKIPDPLVVLSNPEHGSARQTLTNTEAARSQMFFEIGVRQNSQYSKKKTCGGMSFQIY